jgi:hypothetical protein
MRWLAITFPLVLGLLALPGNLAGADDERYVKVEIKGVLQLAQRPGPGVPLGVTVGGQVYELDVKSMPVPPTDKQLKEFDSQLVVVYGRLELRRNAHPLVHVTQIELWKKPKPVMN